MASTIPIARFKKCVNSVNDALDMPSRIRRAVHDAVAAGAFTEGMLLPEVAVIANSLGVSEATARSGLARLVEDGIVASRRGRGGGYWISNKENELARLTDEFIARARVLERDDAIAETLRGRFAALDALYAKRQRREAARYFGKFSSGLTDVAVNHDRYLDE